MSKRIFSGIQPSGVLHLGNYLGAIKQWVELQDEVDEAIFCVVDLHAITVPQEPLELKKNILGVAAIYLAAGIDPNKSSIFVQSTRPEHTELAWILNCHTRIGELSRMTQFKDKSRGSADENIGVGLFDYPVLMAADILLYQTTHVPVGEDQKQHVELTRDLAIRFNNRYGQTFAVPEAIIKKESARIMGLDDPTKKMSKSAASANNYIALTDEPDTIRQKIKRAVTDSGSEIESVQGRPAIANLLNIFSEVSGKSVRDIEQDFSGKGYGVFKEALAESVIEFLRPIQIRYFKYIEDYSGLSEILARGSERVAPLAQRTLEDVKGRIGIGV
ncbi:MAG: tryptophan--tRNA ligase [Patescibacteria group bacterium]|jgi:tryptophanyl-tRNA synthetase